MLPMFAGSCYNWRLQWVLQCRVQVTRVQGVFELESNAAKVGIPLTEKNIYFYMYCIDKNIYIVYEIEPTIWWNVCFEMIWLVSIMFKLYQWCLRIDAWVKGVNGFKVFEYVLRLRFKLCKLLRTCHVETV